MNKLLVFLIVLFCNNTFSQCKKVYITDVSSTDYYFVYRAIEFNIETKDTIILLGNKFVTKDSKIIVLKKNKKYKLKTRLKSAIQISKDKYMFCKPGINILNNTKISNEDSLPILILTSEEIR